MNISYNWLKDLIEHDLTPEQLAAQLTRVGLAVEGIHPHGDDFVLDVDLTSNRPDCLSHLGVAREVSVILDKPLHLASALDEVPIPVALAGETVRIEDPDLCHRFTARIIRNVTVGPSPRWLVDRLEAIGERSINNVADITNYVMLELGQPMHAFDLDKRAGGRIIVRRAMPTETLKTLDEIERKLDNSILAICDAEKPVAIGGVMGGMDTGITDATVNVLLEVAYFNRFNIRATSRTLILATEASYRFERGVDIQNLKRASDRATDLICEVAGGQKGDFVDVYPEPVAVRHIPSDDLPRAVLRLTGVTVDDEQAIRILDRLGIMSTFQNGTREFAPPSWRHDIAIEEDLVEEVARHVGYENVADELPPAYGAGEYQPTEHREKLLRQVLVDQGFDEAITYSFIDTDHDEVFELAPGVIDQNAEERYITLRDSVIEGAVRMRPTLLPGLLAAIRLNLNHQRRDIKLFEVGKVFAGVASEDGLPGEHEVFAIAITGGELFENKELPARELDFYDAKGAIETALDALGVGDLDFDVAEPKHLRKGQAASISLAGREIGTIGRLSDGIASKYKFRQPIFVAEVNLGRVLEEPMAAPSYKPLARFPGISRDVSFVAGRDVSYTAIKAAVLEQEYELCRAVSFVDVYEGKGLSDNERSVTIRLQYRSDERTLIEDEVESTHRTIVASVEQKLGVKQRV
jgi:phenylalanyl-tRNA synthetase beta chain